jgi:hypothetical protein
LNIAVTGSALNDGWMQTLSGRVFYPARPEASSIDIRDIAGALSKLCRYGGHCTRFYSVAEHSVLVAEQAPDDLKLDALLHDASEAYLVDIPRPLKKLLPEYRSIEAKLEQVIAERFRLNYPLPAEVKALDDAILSDERQAIMFPMNVGPEQWGNTRQPLGVRIMGWEPSKACAEFLAAFRKYGGI